MSKTLITALVLATIGTAGVVTAEAKPVWVYPFKGTPYVLPEGHAKQAGTLLKAKRCTPADHAIMIKTGRCPAMG